MDIKSRHQGTSSCRFIAGLTGGEDHVPSVCKREKGGSHTQAEAGLTQRETGSDAEAPEIISQEMLMNLWERFLDSLSLMMMARIAAAALPSDLTDVQTRDREDVLLSAACQLVYVCEQVRMLICRERSGSPDRIDGERESS